MRRKRRWGQEMPGTHALAGGSRLYTSWRRMAARRRMAAALMLSFAFAFACSVDEVPPEGVEAFSAVAERPAGVASVAPELGLPADIPGYPGAIFFMSGTTEQDRLFVSLRTQQAGGAVYAYYRSALWAWGWEIAVEVSEEGRFELEGRKPGRALAVRVDAIGEGSEIALETGPAPASVDSSGAVGSGRPASSI